MSLRKSISLLLLVAFSLTTIAPASAVVTLDNAGVTLPGLGQDEGTAANGANRDVVPVNLRVNVSGGDITFGTISGIAPAERESFSISANGQLSISSVSANGTLSVPRVFILTPPTGTQFVPLKADGYVSADVTLQGNGGPLGSSGLITQNVSTSVGFDNNNLPGSGANGNIIVARVLQENGTTSYFGPTVPKGSIVVYFITANDTGSDTNNSAGSISLTGFGLAADSAGDTALGSSGNIAASYLEPTSANVSEAMVTLDNSDTVNTAQLVDNAGKTEMLLVGTKTGTETSSTVEPDDQPNVVLGSLLSNGSTVKVAPNLITTTTTTSSTINLDTDMLLLRGAERTDSTSSTRTYHQTPFATSEVAFGSVATANGLSSVNSALTSTSNFPNTSNALMSIVFKAVDANGNAADTTVRVDAVSVSLFGTRAFNGIRNATTGGQTGTLALTGFLGAIVNNINGTSMNGQYGVAASYNGSSSSSNLAVRDVNKFDHTTQDLSVGFNGRTSNTSIPSGTTPTTITNGTTTAGIFPGSLITAFDNGNAANFNEVMVSNGSGSSPFSFALETNSGAFFSNSFVANEPVFTTGEVTARLTNNSGNGTSTNAWFTVIGNTNGDNIISNNGNVFAPTNLYDGEFYTEGPTPPKGDATFTSAEDNVIMISRLDGATLQILPVTNKYDGMRDAIAIRPELTLTLGTNSKANGVKIVAEATGGNLNGTVSVTIAEVLAAGSINPELDLQMLPIAGDMSSLMVENGSDAGQGRALIATSSITGASTSTDQLSDLIGTGLVLDDTVPPFFCGGTNGGSMKGVNNVALQPKGRVLLVTENGTDAFNDIASVPNTQLRVVLPAGTDLNRYTATNTNLLGVISSSSGSSSQTFASAPALQTVQSINGGVSQALIYVSVPTLGSPSQNPKRVIGLVFKPNALVIPDSTSDLNATVQVVNTKGTTKTSDDEVLGTIGTVPLADSCSTFLNIAFCQDEFNTFGVSSAPTNLEMDVLDQGSFLTTFGQAPGDTIRLITSGAGADVKLPDICVTEGVPDALPIGGSTDGIPTAFGEQSITTQGTGTIHIASSFFDDGSGTDVGIDTGSTVFFSDTSTITSGALTVANNEISQTIIEGTKTDRQRPFEEMSEFRFTGVTLSGTSSSFLPPTQDLAAWFEASSAATDYVVGSSLPLALKVDTVNGNALAPMTDSASNEADKYISHFFNGDVVDGTTDSDPVDFDDTTSGSNNDLNILFGSTNAPILSNASVNAVDDDNFMRLDSDTTLSVSLTEINGSTTDVQATVFAAPNSLEPGSTIQITTSGTGPSDTAFVPVLPNGSFTANVRADQGQTLTVQQFPSSARTDVPPQVVSLNVEDQNVDPTLLSAVSEDISGLGELTAKGTAPVLFTVTASGKVDGESFLPTADQLKLGDNSVMAVPGTNNKFISILDFSKSSGSRLTATVGGTTSTVDLSGVNSSNPTLGGRPIVRKVRENDNGFVVVKGRRLRRVGLFGFILEDGTYQPVDLRNPTRGDRRRRRRRSASTESIPATAKYAVFHVAGRGIFTLEL